MEPTEKVNGTGAEASAAETGAGGETEATLEAEAEAPAESPAAPENPPEVEVFYTFRWAPRARPRGDTPRRGGGRSDRGGASQADSGVPARTDAQDGKPRGRRNGEGRGGPKGQGAKGPKGKGGKRDGERREQGGRSFSSGPERKRDRIDPDNPFAAALMGLKDSAKKDG